MRRMRVAALALISFVVALLGAFLSPGTCLHRSLALALCGLLSANPILCTVNATKITNAVNATNPQKIETVLPERELVAQRSREFNDPPPSNPTRNLPSTNPAPPSFPNDPGPNFPVRRPDFDDNLTVTTSSRGFQSGNTKVREIKNNVFEITKTTPNRCNVIRLINGASSLPHLELIRINPVDITTCKIQPYSFYFYPDGKVSEIEFAENQSFIFQSLSSLIIRVSFKYQGKMQAIQEISYIRNNPKLKSVINNVDDRLLMNTPGIFYSTKDDYLKQNFTADIDGIIGDLVCGICENVKQVMDKYFGKHPFDYGAASNIDDAIQILLSIGNTPSFVGNVGSHLIGNLSTSFPDIEKLITGTTDLGVDCSRDLLAYTGTSFRCDKKDDLSNQGSQTGRNRGSQQGEQLAQKLLQQQELQDQRRNPNQNNKSGSSYGDPHIVTFDGYRYSFQTIGEFTLVKSVDGNFEVQTRQSPVLNAQLSMNSAVAIKAGNSRIAIYGQGLPDGDSSTPIRVDGRPFPTQGGTLPNGTAITQQGQGSYVVQLPTGEVISARRIQRNNLSYMDVNPSVPTSRQYVGLLGNANGNPADDLQMRNGQIIETKQTYGQIAQTASSFIPGLGRISGLVGKVENLVFAQLYREFGNSWRISQAESLFDYKPGQSTETFTDRGFPSSYKTLDMLSAAQIEAATTACRQANVPAEQLEGCIFDVGFTGDTGFAQTASEALGLIRDIGKLIPGGIPIPTQIPLPVRIPGLPF